MKKPKAYEEDSICLECNKISITSSRKLPLHLAEGESDDVTSSALLHLSNRFFAATEEDKMKMNLFCMLVMKYFIDSHISRV